MTHNIPAVHSCCQQVSAIFDAKYCQSEQAAMYSASVLECVTVVWREEDQWMDYTWPTRTPEMEALVSIQLA
jgi:hypothetical protein